MVYRNRSFDRFVCFDIHLPTQYVCLFFCPRFGRTDGRKDMVFVGRSLSKSYNVSKFSPCERNHTVSNVYPKLRPRRTRTLLRSSVSPTRRNYNICLFHEHDEEIHAFNIPIQTIVYRGRTGAVVSIADYGPKGPLFETWPDRRSLWP